MLEKCVRETIRDDVNGANRPTFETWLPIAPATSSAPIPASSNATRRVIQCDICEKQFHTEQNLRLHLAEIHAPNGRKRFRCGDCGNVYSRLRSLERHQNKAHRSSAEDPRCPACGKKVVNVQLHFKKFHCKSKAVQTKMKKPSPRVPNT